jgi:tetratricopeptide (TPR) repeat protein
LYGQSVETAQRAIKAAPNYAEPHLWLADSLRLTEQHQRAKAEYERYLALSNFDTKLAGQLNYYVLGFLIGMGKKTRATQRDIWAELRSLAYFGICDCEYRLSRFDSAIQNCQAALTYDRSDPYTHHVLGLGFMQKAIESGEVEGLEAASQHFRTVIKLNPHIPEAEMARQNIKNIEEYKRTAVTQAWR